jgi:ubiquinone biosynthesis protein UbiJ
MNDASRRVTQPAGSVQHHSTYVCSGLEIAKAISRGQRMKIEAKRLAELESAVDQLEKKLRRFQARINALEQRVHLTIFGRWLLTQMSRMKRKTLKIIWSLQN